MWLSTGLVGIGLILVTLFGEETVYRRDLAVEERPRAADLAGRFQMLIGVAGFRAYRGGVRRVVSNMLVMISRPYFTGLCGMSVPDVAN
jgi:hypothetical protein